jgi:hypothetical protein
MVAKVPLLVLVKARVLLLAKARVPAKVQLLAKARVPVPRTTPLLLLPVLRIALLLPVQVLLPPLRIALLLPVQVLLQPLRITLLLPVQVLLLLVQVLLQPAQRVPAAMTKLP